MISLLPQLYLWLLVVLKEQGYNLKEKNYGRYMTLLINGLPNEFHHQRVIFRKNFINFL